MTTTARLGYRPELDGLRAVAVGTVVGFHAAAPGFGGGAVGVTWFFVLSGFLITTLLLEEADRGEIDIRRFYLRRVVRLLPALYVMLATFAVISALSTRPATHIDVREFVASGLYFMNMYKLAFGAIGAPFMIHVWSLSLEEQFYVIWPWMVKYVRSTRALACTAGAAIALAVGARILIMFDITQSAWLSLPFFTLDSFTIGAVLAYVRRRVTVPTVVYRGAIVALAVVIMALDVILDARITPVLDVVRVTLSQCAVAVLILHIVNERTATIPRVLGLRPLVYVGGLSYAIYLWHHPFFAYFAATRQPDMSAVMRYGLKFGLTAIASVATYHLVEQPLVRYRNRLRARDVSSAAPVQAHR